MPPYDTETEKKGLPTKHHNNDSVGEQQNPDTSPGTTDMSEQERSFDSPSATDQDRPQNQPDKSDNADNNNDKNSPETPDSLYNPDNNQPKKGKFRFTPLQKRGGIAGIFITIVIIILTTLSAGPLQFIHMSQILQKLHFANSSSMRQNRLVKTVRWLRSGKTQDTRLGFVSNKYAIRVEGKMSKAGITTEWDNLKGIKKSTIVDFNKLKKSPVGADIPDKLPQQLEYLKSMGIDINKPGNIQILGDGKIRVMASDLGVISYKKYKVYNSLETLGLKAAGYNSKTLNAIIGRNLKARSLSNFHPVQRLNRKANEPRDKIFAYVLNKFKENIRAGTKGGPISVQGEGVEDAEGKKGPPSEDAIKVGDEATDIGSNPEATKVKLPKAKIIIGATFITAILCMVKNIADNIEDINAANKFAPMVRAGVQMIALGEQIESNQDIDIESLGAISTLMYDEKTGSWANAESIQAQIDGKKGGTPLPGDAKLTSKENIVSQIFDTPGFEQAINLVCSSAGTFIQTIIGFATGPVSAAIQEVFMRGIGNKWAGKGIDSLVNMLAGEALDITKYKGGEFGAVVDAGAFLASNEANKTDGGRPLTKEESASLKNIQNDNIAQEYKQKSIFNKYFNPYDSNTAVAKAIDSQNPDVGKNIAKMPIKLLGYVGSSAKNISSIFSHKSFAANNTYDYGLPEIGFSEAEINNPIVNNPIQNAEEASKILTSSEGQKYKDIFIKCYNLTVKDDLSSQTDTAANARILYEGENGLMTKYNKGDCGDPNDEKLLRIRMAIFDTNTMQALACTEGDEESCNNYFSPTSTNESTNITSGINNDVSWASDTSDIQCDPRTKDIGIAEGYKEGNKAKIRLCLINNDTYFDVNSQISGNIVELLKKAKNDGLTLTGTGYRTMQEQINIWNGGGCNPIRYSPNATSHDCGGRIAWPGTSNHQMGLAIDFDNCGWGQPTTVGRQTQCYKWLKNNASKFGLKNYPAETWHWSVNGG